jgi:hypothetical protein
MTLDSVRAMQALLLALIAHDDKWSALVVFEELGVGEVQLHRHIGGVEGVKGGIKFKIKQWRDLRSSRKLQ